MIRESLQINTDRDLLAPGISAEKGRNIKPSAVQALSCRRASEARSAACGHWRVSSFDPNPMRPRAQDTIRLAPDTARPAIDALQKRLPGGKPRP